jgi:polyisoprenoid-binding protein YceI
MTETQTTAVPLAPGSWTLDPAHSSVGFTIRHLGVSKVRGRFLAFTADVVVGQTLEESTVAATVDLASIDTGNADRDAHVRSPDIIDVERRPTLTFRSTALVARGDTWQLVGEASIGDVTRPLTLSVELGGVQDAPDGSRHAGFEAFGELRRKDFGIDLALPPGVSGAVLGDVVKIELDIQLLAPSA